MSLLMVPIHCWKVSGARTCLCLASYAPTLYLFYRFQRLSFRAKRGRIVGSEELFWIRLCVCAGVETSTDINTAAKDVDIAIMVVSRDFWPCPVSKHRNAVVVADVELCRRQCMARGLPGSFPAPGYHG